MENPLHKYIRQAENQYWKNSDFSVRDFLTKGTAIVDHGSTSPMTATPGASRNRRYTNRWR
jgi:hypothetical protein